MMNAAKNIHLRSFKKKGFKLKRKSELFLESRKLFWTSSRALRVGTRVGEGPKGQLHARYK